MSNFGAVAALVLMALVLALGGLVGCPTYRVYTQRMEGEAELARANSNRQIAVAEAKAKLEGAKLLSEAEVERAKGTAEANRIVAEGLGGPEGYLRYLWIQTLESGKNDVIYVPTEANLPVLEATRKAPTPVTPRSEP